MNKIILTGNLTRDPETGTTPEGVNWTRFSLAVRRRSHREGQPDADFVRVTAWRGLADSCAKYLAKGRKVAVSGTAESHAWMSRDGEPRSQLEITADDVEFLTPKAQSDQPTEPPPESPDSGFVEVDGDDLPF